MLNQSKNDLTNRGRVGTGGGGSYGLIDLFFGERLPGLLYCLSSRSLHLPQAKDNLRDLSHGNTERERERDWKQRCRHTSHVRLPTRGGLAIGDTGGISLTYPTRTRTILLNHCQVKILSITCLTVVCETST